MNTKNTIPVVSHSNFKALDIAIRAAGEAITLVDKVPGKFKSLQDQVIRAASSVPANLAEGHGRTGRARMNHYRIAYGSAREVDVHLKILAGAGVVDQVATEETLERFDHVRAMIWRLTHPKG